MNPGYGLSSFTLFNKLSELTNRGKTYHIYLFIIICRYTVSIKPKESKLSKENVLLD